MIVTKVDRVVSIEVQVGCLQCKVSQVGCVSKVLICATLLYWIVSNQNVTNLKLPH